MTRDGVLQVYQTELPRLRSLVRKYMGYGSPDVEDILQDVFVQAWLHCDKIREDNRCAGWLARIAANTCVTYLRRSKRDMPCEPFIASEAEDVVSRVMVRLMLEEAIARLSPSARQAVWLYDLEGYPLKEVAHRMHKPESAVKSALYRARTAMRNAQAEPLKAAAVG